ncbi:OmpW family outer membrane protein [Pseudoxanthomonas sp. CF125]|uniref:OmpW/AlkL family protein n=1 Tax=Pseudoxanthomonas sp. CF125 TaxID=1855303 RepID=UPI00087F2D9A|nr:OmpW family outer membrane protein [Pseudoxanthomonas sp. CF125]SDQ78736.1 outer membrane protein [Pseudoxanthomonas sp. CF125]
MSSLRPLSIALLSALAFAPSAFAQDTDTTTTDASSTQTASGKRIAIVGGGAILQPDSDPAPGLDIDGGSAPTLSASWYVNDNIAIELWGAADKFNHRVRGPEGKIGTVEQQPLALSGQYHFRDADAVMRPFVGLGYYESNFSNEDISAGGPHVGLDSTKGAIATAGMDFNINSRWFARTDVRYMRGDADVNLAGEGTGEQLKMNPWTIGVGLGARF